MRNLINLIETLSVTEAVTLDPTQIKKRFRLFTTHIRNGKPFYTQDGTPVVLQPSEADRFQKMYDNDSFSGRLMAQGTDGKMWPLSGFLKTKDFGGQAVIPGQEEEDGDSIGKEAAAVKPTQIKITDVDYNSTTLANAVINNKILNSTDYGRAIISVAKNIISGETPVIPKEYIKNNQIKKAIVDYAGEYLGVLALVYGQSDFPKKQEFLSWLGGDLSSLTLRFPSKTNLALADSFATIVNPDSQHQINISSKGTGGGAAPSVSGLVVPDHLKRKSKYKDAIDFIEICQDKSLPKPATISQVFMAMNLLHERSPESIPPQFSKFLPWDTSIISDVNNSIASKQPMSEYQSLWSGINFKSDKASDGGKLTYVVKQAVLNAVNGGALPEFEAAVLEILDYNFIQQYTTVENKTGKLNFHTQWPAKLDGSITLETKSGAGDPTKGSFSFKLKPKGTKADAGDAGQVGAGGPVAPSVITGKRVELKPKSAPKANKPAGDPGLGRQRR